MGREGDEVVLPLIGDVFLGFNSLFYGRYIGFGVLWFCGMFRSGMGLGRLENGCVHIVMLVWDRSLMYLPFICAR